MSHPVRWERCERWENLAVRPIQLVASGYASRTLRSPRLPPSHREHLGLERADPDAYGQWVRNAPEFPHCEDRVTLLTLVETYRRRNKSDLVPACLGVREDPQVPRTLVASVRLSSALVHTKRRT